MMKDSTTELEAVRATVASVAHHIDAKRWAELRALYDSEVETDYTSLFGGTPVRQAGDALIEGWRRVLDQIKTQHLLGPIVATIDGARATGRCHVRAMHHAKGAPSGEQWEVLGHYVFELSRQGAEWRITAMKLETLMQLGNTSLLQEAVSES